MEEILSSIRRIIADETAEEDGEQDGEQDAGGSRAEALDRDPDAPPGTQDDAAAEDDDVLELTEVVREDAEIIDLDRALAQSHPIEQRQLEAVADAPGRDEPEPDPDERDQALSDGSAAPRGTPPAAEAFAEQPDDHTAQSPMNIQDDEMEDHQAAMQKKNGPGSLVSDRAAGAATGAFAKLAQAVQRTPPELAIADDSGRTVEQFFEDMMRPMLRDWIDANLPTLVERIVQKEIQKIVRRAEDE